MNDRLQNSWQVVRSSLGFLPTLLTLMAVVLAFGLLALDTHFASKAVPLWLFPGGPAGAREILSIIATSIITIAGVAFSITIVALTLAASQYGSLLLSSYLRDPVSQIALGVFVGTFVYCVVVLSNVSEVEDERFMPAISVSFSLLLALASLGSFVTFINRLAQSMQSEHLAARIGESLFHAVTEMFPEELGDEPQEVSSQRSLPERFETDAWPIQASASGYLQAIEGDSLMKFAKKRDLVIRLLVRPGAFISAETSVALVLGGMSERQEVEREIERRLLIGRLRTPTQDVEYAVHQLAQIAVRALSTGINDPYTALTCIDWLEAALRHLTRRRLPSEYRVDDRGALRVVAPGPGFELMANAAFNKVRHAGRHEASILMRLMNAVGNVAAQARRPADLAALSGHLIAIRDDALAGLPTEREKMDAVRLYAELTRKHSWNG